jgi:Tol biopolymer transport system component
LTRTRTTSEYGPVFSPDGLSIVFARRDAGSPNVDLWTMDPSGGNAAVLLSTPSDSEYPLAWRPT